jgi:hypothetical protein
MEEFGSLQIITDPGGPKTYGLYGLGSGNTERTEGEKNPDPLNGKGHNPHSLNL